MTLRPVHRTTGDIIADRRFAYARAAFDNGEWEIAADLARQTLEVAPGFAAAHQLLGQALLILDRHDDARRAFEAAIVADPDDELGAGIELARLGAIPQDAAMSPGYIRALFDQYAPDFERHLTDDLRYTAPQMLWSHFLRASAGSPVSVVIDLGCGTGLMAQCMAGEVETIIGIDLSADMLAEALETGLYDELHAREAVDYLEQSPRETADLIIAADVLVYIGDLARLFAGCRRVLKPGGFLAVTVQIPDDNGPDVDARIDEAQAGMTQGHGGFVLGRDNRFHHAPAYLARVASGAGFDCLGMDARSMREDRGTPVPGMTAIFRKPSQ